jgi:phage terminase large subunit
MPEAINKRFHCDSARPDSIAQLNHDGLNCEGATKSKGSIEAGIEYLKGKQIIVNPDCKNMIYELYNYKYKIDKQTSQITTDIIDANNHLIDALRYALYKQISEAKKPLNALYTNPNYWS